MKPTVNVLVSDEQNDLPIDLTTVEPLVVTALQQESVTAQEVSVRFVTPPTIVALHTDYFNDSSLTDCISFPIDEGEGSGYRVLGEVVVCPKVAIDYASDHKTNPYEELSLYVVHGLLHLMGYDDQSTQEQTAMRNAEARCLLTLRQSNQILRGPCQSEP